MTTAPETPAEPFSAVVVNFRRYDLLADCIRALVDSTRPPVRIVVVDNESDAARLADSLRPFPAVTAIANTANLGYATACNQGWRSTTSRFVLFLNPDVTLEPGCLERCLEEAGAHDDIAVVTCRLVRPDGRLDHACHRGLPTPAASLAYSLKLHRLRPRSRRFARYTMSWLDPGTVHDVEACSGAFMLVRRDVLEALGGWDERYWFYAEDIDLCLRVGQRGGRVRYVGNATATHLKGASSRLRDPNGDLTRDERAHKHRVQRAIVESHRLFFREHYEGTTPRLVAQAIMAMFRLQLLRLRLATRRDALRGR